MEAKSTEQSNTTIQNENEPPEWSDNEAQWLKYEEFIAQVSKLRSRPESPKAWWQKILESGGGAALITVLIGGVLGQLISMNIQSNLSYRDFKQSLRKAQNDQALVAYNKFLDLGAETIKHAYELIGNCISSSEDLVSTKSADFNESQTQKDKIAQRFNDTGKQWRTEQLQLGLLMKYYHHDDADVACAWQTVQDTTTAYMKCERSIYANTKGAPESCQDQKQAIMKALDLLTARRLEVAKKYELKVLDEPVSR
jgi:hypothetical protein